MAKGAQYNDAGLLSQRDALAMRGVAILFIVVHNLLRWVLPTVENEFDFSAARVTTFLDSLSNHPEWAIADVVTFLGWYGVAVFIFLSGYGLVRRYEGESAGRITIGRFVAHRWLKLFRLIIIPMVLFAIVWSLLHGRIFPLDKLLWQITMTANVVMPTSINPGIYWYFGVAFELYLFYRLVVYRRPASWLVVANVIVITLLVVLHIYADVPTIEAVRHNLFAWLLPFSLGFCAARYDISSLFRRQWLNVVWLLGSGVVLTAMNYNPYSWIFSPVVAIFGAVALTRITTFGWRFGELSAWLFAIHPVVRLVMLTPAVKELFFAEDISPYCLQLVVYVGLYLFAVVLAALLYRRCHALIFARR